ncbi:MAG: hypothetical protein WC144_05885 [Sulfurimonas sp.]|jgi:hypothetical protein|nr:hypothetical protein [Sulfurimonadaceae bacterium]
MQIVVDNLRKSGKIYKKMQEILPKEIGSKNRLKIYKAVDLDGYFSAIFVISQKSKFFIKDIKKLDELLVKLTIYCDHSFKHKVLFLDAPLCTKVKPLLKKQGWSLKHGTL